jgi:2-polyprenyl-3-methyl-5-hydroxy-6-metoxy-1,4-benzoquinol methylase
MNEKTMQETVKAGYDEGDYADVYRNRLSLTPFEKLFFEGLIQTLNQGSKILDLGSGPGIPYDLNLMQMGCNVTGIDISEKHITLARNNVPQAEYILGDFLDYPFPQEEFDAVISLYALFHIPRDRHMEVISKIASTIKPNGHLLITVGTEDVDYKERDSFCKSKMAWSYFDTATNMGIISQCGFTILKALNEKDYGSTEKHLWILAVKND